MHQVYVNNCVFGRGVFSSGLIYPGETVLEFKGPFTDRQHLPPVGSIERDYYLQIDNDRFLGPSGLEDDLVNHSCCPNTAVRIIPEGIFLRAIRLIYPHEEITFDYSTTNWESEGTMKCACLNSACRQVIGDFIDLPESVKKMYIDLDIIPDFILKNIILLSD